MECVIINRLQSYLFFNGLMSEYHRHIANFIPLKLLFFAFKMIFQFFQIQAIPLLFFLIFLLHSILLIIVFFYIIYNTGLVFYLWLFHCCYCFSPIIFKLQQLLTLNYNQFYQNLAFHQAAFQGLKSTLCTPPLSILSSPNTLALLRKKSWCYISV